jgi:choline dehydrogenase
MVSRDGAICRCQYLTRHSYPNLQIYQRPTVGSMQSWVDKTGDASWGFEARKGDFMKSMTFTPPKHNLRQEIPEAQYVASDFGSSAASAPLSVSYPNHAQNFSKYMQLSANELGVKTVDSFTGGSLLGVQYNAATIRSNTGHRSTSRDFYATVEHKSNFRMFFQTYAKKILFKSVNGKPKAVAVTISTNWGGTGTTNILYANKEIIVSAGAFQTPQLLMVSGIGPKSQLSQFKITPVAINENVGQGMQDHIFFGVSSSRDY